MKNENKRLLLAVFFVLIIMLICFSISSGQTLNTNIYDKYLTIPNGQTIFGEKVPINMMTNDRFAYVMAFHIDHIARTIIVLERLSELDKYITKILRKNRMHPDFKYLFAWESGLDPRANSGKAVGFAQFKRYTARIYGLKVTSWGDKNGRWDIDERMCPKAFEAGAEYLADLKEKLSNPLLVAAAYNTGSQRITRKMSEQNTDNYWNIWMYKETEDFIYHILAIKILYESGVIKFKKRYPIDFKIEKIKLKKNTTLSEYCKKHNLNFIELSRWNRHFREGVIPKRIEIEIYMPKKLKLFVQK